MRIGLILSCSLVGTLGFSADKTNGPQGTRRGFFDQLVKTGATAFVVSGIAPPAALALGGANKVNTKLLSYGLPQAIVPNGLVPLFEIYGRGKNRFPLAVTFSHPVDWVVTLPSNDVNGEDGQIQAGEYAKGDTATLFVNEEAGHVSNLASKDKEFFGNMIIKAISQKGANVYQNFKVIKVEPGDGGYKNQEYVTVDFKYQLLTGAGFEIDRKGVASVTSEGKAVEVFWTASTTQRYKKTEQTLRDMVSTFRCYADGLSLGSEKIQYADEM
mmetsp:Transcript_5263/g.7349  ORF Transcript_5263/g.7349 Transcript_5263/m.7349 type:complete len:271 (+) Transcript_5263:96-908(+)